MEAEQELICVFCGNAAGDDAVMGEEGDVACKACGEAEMETQKREGLVDGS